ncbi:MAG: type II secretion system F family protein [Bryobacteraceae bacterium]
MALFLAAGLFVLLMATITVFGYRRYARPARILDRLSGEAAEAAPVLIPLDEKPKERLLIRMAKSIGDKMPISPQDASLARRYLIAAGFRSENAIRILYGAKVLSCIGLLVLTILLRETITSSPILRNVLVVTGGLAGYFLPGFLLERMVAARQERIRLALPDALDLLVVCVEAGLGLDQAINNVSQELKNTHKDISEELALVNLEMRAGKPRVEALRNLADRSGEAELRKLVAVLIQADRFGVSVADSLRTHSDFMRIRRRQEAEERAAKVGVKLVFPIFFCIMPSMMLVTAGPGVLQLFRNLYPLMESFGR